MLYISVRFGKRTPHLHTACGIKMMLFIDHLC